MEEETFDDEIARIQAEADFEAERELELEWSMRQAYATIEDMGWNNWDRLIDIPSDRKKIIVTNMLQWHEKREEFERCSFICEGLKLLNSPF
jgi:hypothetical protein